MNTLQVAILGSLRPNSLVDLVEFAAKCKLSFRGQSYVFVAYNGALPALLLVIIQIYIFIFIFYCCTCTQMGADINLDVLRRCASLTVRCGLAATAEG